MVRMLWGRWGETPNEAAVVPGAPPCGISSSPQAAVMTPPKQDWPEVSAQYECCWNLLGSWLEGEVLKPILAFLGVQDQILRFQALKHRLLSRIREDKEVKSSGEHDPC